MANPVTRLGNLTTASVASADTKTSPWTFDHTVPTGTNFIVGIFSCRENISTVSGSAITLPVWNGESFTRIRPTDGQNAWADNNGATPCTTYMDVFVLFPSTTNTTATLSVSYATSNKDTLTATIINYSGVEDQFTVSEAIDVISDDENFRGTTSNLAATGISPGEYQFIASAVEGEGVTFTINNGWAEVNDNTTGAGANDSSWAVHDTDSFTDDDVTQTVTASATNNTGVSARFRLNEKLISASGSGTLGAVTNTAATKRPPRVYLNTTQTKAGATELAVQSYNDAGTSLTFNDPQGTGPTGSVFLGIENTSTRFIDWQAVTVNTGPIGSGTPSITPIEAAGNALRTTVTVTDVANSGETPGAGSETWNDGSSGNVITGTGFV